MPEGQGTIHRDLKKHEKQAHVNLTRFKAECRILHLAGSGINTGWRMKRAVLLRRTWGIGG